MFAPDKMRIALFTYSTQPRGGVFYTLSLAEALHDRGHDVVLFALADAQGGFARAPRCPTVLLQVDSIRDDIVPFVRRRIAAYVDGWDATTRQFDVFHAHDGISANALATLVERGHIERFVRTVHHLDDFKEPQLAALQDRSVVRAAQHLVVSDVWRNRLERQYGIAATVVPSGVDAQRFRPVSCAQRAALRARLGHADRPLFVSIGGIEARKNALAILEAFALVHERLPQARLCIAGGASIFAHSAYRANWNARAQQLGLLDGDALQCIGVVSDAEIVTLLQAASALVFPSLVEGFGLVVLEALACATPVITSRIAPFLEYVSADEVIFVDPKAPALIADAMLRSLDDTVVAQAQTRGPQVARRFAWDTSARSHEQAYRAMFCGASIAYA